MRDRLLEEDRSNESGANVRFEYWTV